MTVESSFGQDILLPDSERFSVESRKRLSAPAVRTFVSIANTWHLTHEQSRMVLGNSSRSAYYQWRRKAHEHRSLVLSVDVLMRISGVLGIHAALSQLFAVESEAREWLRSPHQAAPFGGRQPLDLVVGGSLDGILQVRRFLDAAMQGIYMPPGTIDVGFVPYEDSEIAIQEVRVGETDTARSRIPPEQ